MQTIDAISETLQKSKIIKHTLQLTRILPFEKLSAKQCYLLLIHNEKETPTAQTKICEILGIKNIDWYCIYSLGKRTTLD